MKIVIDMPEEEYERMKEQSMFGSTMPDLYHSSVGRRDASDYENWAAFRERLKAKMNDKFGASEKEGE